MRLFLAFASRPDLSRFLWHVCSSILSAFNTFVSRTGCLLVTYYILPLWQVVLCQNNQCYWRCWPGCIFSFQRWSKQNKHDISFYIYMRLFCLICCHYRPLACALGWDLLSLSTLRQRGSPPARPWERFFFRINPPQPRRSCFPILYSHFTWALANMPQSQQVVTRFP